MHDLRRQALESGKTVSRKARSRQSSAASSKANSAVNSRAASRNTSRHASDDEDNLSDGTAWSANSIDDLLSPDDVDAPPDAYIAELNTRVEQIIDRKRSSTEGRTESLSAYTHILTAHYVKDNIERQMGEIIPAILKSIKSETTEKETAVALKALAVTVVTVPSESIYDAVYQTVKRIMSHSESILVKTAAIHTLGATAFYGGASDSELEDIMSMLLEIVESDGLSVEAHDDPSVVTAALEEWGFLATQLDDLEDITEEAIEAFVEQLQSADAGVAIAAGENIALLYEKSYTEQEDDEEVPSDDESDEETDPTAPKMIKRYAVYRREDQLRHTLESLATISGRNISKKDKKSLHSNFADILNSVENPTRGPRYQSAINQETGKRYGSRMTVRIHRTGEMRIDQWWKLHRLKALRRILQGGFVQHYENNEVVFESLPIIISSN